MEAPVIPVLVPDMPSTAHLIPYLTRIENSKVYSNGGPLSVELTSRFAEYFKVDADCICLVSNATVGIIGSLICSGQTENVIETPSFTFSATLAAIISAGLEPLMVDIDSNFRMLPTGKNDTVLDVLPFGHKLRDASWYEKFKFSLIDAAASFDALEGFGKYFSLRNTYSLVVSLHATKLLGAGEGGVVISNNREFIRRIKEWSNFGFSSISPIRESIFAGNNAKLSEYSCAVALASLDRWTEVKNLYKNNLQLAQRITKASSFSLFDTTREGIVTPYWIVRHESEKKLETLRKVAKAESIETREWWGKGCHRMPAYSNCTKTSLIETEKQSVRYLGLPFHNFLTADDWSRIEKLFYEVVKHE